MNIVLIGMKGVGKTTLGRVLAKQLQRSFVDCDEHLCEEYNCTSVQALYAQLGQGEFRAAETLCLKNLCNTKENSIIATGGGCTDNMNNHPIIKNLGQVIYLWSSFEQCYQQLLKKEALPSYFCRLPTKSEFCMFYQYRDQNYRKIADKIHTVNELLVTSFQ